jgi:hypothetical protein
MEDAHVEKKELEDLESSSKKIGKNTYQEKKKMNDKLIKINGIKLLRMLGQVMNDHIQEMIYDKNCTSKDIFYVTITAACNLYANTALSHMEATGIDFEKICTSCTLAFIDVLKQLVDKETEEE